jgi:Putative beta-barrel porin 2
MKKIVASVGLVALGASSVGAVYGQGMDATPYKPWSVSASLRGFYDDNINTVPSNTGLKKGSFGVQVSPGFNLDWKSDQNTLDLGYIYTLRWYEKRPYNNTSDFDQDHTFNLAFDHTFNERSRLGVTDSFVIGQEPDFLRSSYALTEPQRVSGENIRNYGTIDLTDQLTPLFGIAVGYANNYVDYHDDSGNTIAGFIGPVPVLATSPSLSSELDRIEQTLHLDGRWQVMPETVGVLGYQYGESDYTEGTDLTTLRGILGFIRIPGPPGFVDVPSNSRNYRAHYGYVGADHNFRPDLAGSLRVGVRDTDYYNSPNGQNSLSPYVMASLRYTYMVESYAEVGFSYDRNATDIATLLGDSLTLDQESAVLYANVKHRILPKVYGSLMGQFQDSTFNGGSVDGKSERFYLVGLDLQYQFNQNLSADIGYNYDKLDSDLGRSFDRNRVYIGLTAKY